jgi:hypothetical protein
MERLTICKKNGKILFHDFGGYESRNLSTLWCIIHADKIYHWADFDKIDIFTHDYQRTNELTYSNTKNDYKTMDLTFMESVWWVFKSIWDKGLIYQGNKIVPYSPALQTALSNFEAGQNYQDIQDPAVTILFRTKKDPNTYFAAWTTTPWTLPSNLALCVHPEIEYVKVKDLDKNIFIIMAKARLEAEDLAIEAGTFNQVCPCAREWAQVQACTRVRVLVRVGP